MPFSFFVSNSKSLLAAEKDPKEKKTRKMAAFARPPPAIARRFPSSKARSLRSSSVRRACVAVAALMLTLAATAVSSSSLSSSVAVFSTALITPSIARLTSVVKSAKSFPRCAGVAARLIATAVDAGGEN